MVKKRSVSEIIFDAINFCLMIVLVIITLYPLVYVLFASVSLPSKLMQHRGILIKPLGFDISSYKLVFKNPMIIKGYMNTLFYLIFGTTLNIFMNILGAYVLSRKNILLKNALMFFIVFTMFFQGGLIPSYLIVQKLGFANTRWALIIPVAVSSWNIIIMRTSFMGIPDSLEESARIDGAKDYTILFKIIVPLSTPVIAVMILFYGVYHWNSWFPAMVYLRKRELYPLQLILREILIANDMSRMLVEVGNLDKEPVAETVKYATIIIVIVPILFIYPFLQKYFIKGIMIGALKG